MLRIKKEYRSKTVQVNGKSGIFMFDCSKDYTQEQLSKFNRVDGFRDYIESDEPIKEIELKNVVETAPEPIEKERESYPVLDHEVLESTPLPKLRKIYPFVKNTSKAGFIEDLYEMNFGNPVIEKE